ncbi:MAG TPA: DUF4395 domain-containing protein [Gallionellaceae bacterium]|nr:DUF4395 domain-containing protein [Gallionellaceae bacterium]
MSAQVDHAEIKLGQIFTIIMATAAFILSDPRWLIALGAIFLVTALYRPLSPFVLVYRNVVRPLGVMHSDYRLDNIQPHTFGQLVGALTVAIALALLYAGYGMAGWAIVWILSGLTLTSYLGWCIGCFMYYRINRLGLRGFFRHAPTDRSVRLGQRPRKEAAQPGSHPE